VGEEVWLIDINPFQGMAAEIKLQKSKGEEEEISPFTSAERDRIIDAFKADRYYSGYAPLVIFLFYTGCRPSEALALFWKSINTQSITFQQVLIYDGKKLVLQDGLKTQKSRKFPINTQLTEVIAAIQSEDCKPDSLVFPSPQGKFIDWHNFTNRAWTKVLESLPDIEYRNPYQMRHTFCSLCREKNIPSIQLAKWVGNSAEMIDRVYAKVVNSIQVPTL
jgi:integrase